MAQVQRHLLIWALLVPAFAQKFYPDDPLWRTPKPSEVRNPHVRRINDLYDFILNSVATPYAPKPGIPSPKAVDINTLGEVPDSMWYTNRHYWNPSSVTALKLGPGESHRPVPPYRIVGAKTQGITIGFQMMDSKGNRYLCKPDPLSNPEMATAADVVTSKFFYALGYNVPENYIVEMAREDLSIDPEAKARSVSGKDRRMNAHDVEHIFQRIPKTPGGRYRLMASLFIAGKSIGPFRWYGMRTDDPDDIYPHENMRALRGLYVFCSWLNHTDVKANNTFDTIQTVDGVPAIRHYLIDFGSSLGSDSDEPKDARFGHRYLIEKDKVVVRKMETLGFYSEDWERAHFPAIPAVGNFEAQTFHPWRWTPNYQNSAFLNLLPDDGFWAAKQVMAFSREEIRALVETGQYSDPRATAWIVETLVERQRRIGKYYFSKVLPLDRFEVRGGKLQFEDLNAKYGLAQPSEFRIQWRSFDNMSGRAGDLIPDGTGPAVPRGVGYAMAEITATDATKVVRVYLRDNRVVGIERTW